MAKNKKTTLASKAAKVNVRDLKLKYLQEAERLRNATPSPIQIPKILDDIQGEDLMRGKYSYKKREPEKIPDHETLRGKRETLPFYDMINKLNNSVGSIEKEVVRPASQAGQKITNAENPNIKVKNLNF